ncbi:MAG: YIP1 family protein [Acidobacteria bacterium]|nr:YIP1 family protein [Acidobacteriota bacterium]
MDDQQQVPGPAPSIEQAAATPGVSEIGRLTGIYFSPGEVFADVNRKPTWVIPILISVIVAMGFSLYFTKRVSVDFDQMIRQQMQEKAAEQGRELTEEQVEAALKVASITTRFAWAFPVAVVPLLMLVITGALFAGFQMLQAETTFKKAFSVVTWSHACVSIVEYGLGAIVIAANPEAVDPTRPNDITMTNLGAFFSAKEISPALHSLLSAVDIFTIWLLILLVIGFKAISRRFTTGKSATIVVGAWALWVLAKMAWGLLV